MEIIRTKDGRYFLLRSKRRGSIHCAMQLLKPFCLVVAMALSSHGALIISSFETIYSENFDGLGTAGGAWANNSTLPNWYSSETTVTANDGSATSQGLYNFATAGNPGDRSLGSIGGTVTYGLQLLNSSGLEITSMTVSYIGTTWRDGDEVNRLTFEYFVGNPAFVDSEEAGWVAVSALNFSSSAAQSALTADITGLSIANGQNFWFRWSDAASPGQDASLGINDLALTVPEPRFYTLASVCFLGLIAVGREWRARRRARALAFFS